MNAESRGYQKLATAAHAFHFDFRGKVVLDIGSSTGGFSQYALEHGAKRVIAVEKGTNQMSAPLRFDPRIELHEKTDIFDVTIHAKKSKEHSNMLVISAPDVILADVSFISLTTVLAYAADHLATPRTEFLVMCKPQFEASPSQLVKGVIKNSATRRTVLKHFETWLKTHHFVIVSKRDNQLAGRAGNLERFYLLKISR